MAYATHPHEWSYQSLNRRKKDLNRQGKKIDRPAGMSRSRCKAVILLVFPGVQKSAEDSFNSLQIIFCR
jgi:hypothetical protein